MKRVLLVMSEFVKTARTYVEKLLKPCQKNTGNPLVNISPIGTVVERDSSSKKILSITQGIRRFVIEEDFIKVFKKEKNGEWKHSDTVPRLTIRNTEIYIYLCNVNARDVARVIVSTTVRIVFRLENGSEECYNLD